MREWVRFRAGRIPKRNIFLKGDRSVITVRVRSFAGGFGRVYGATWLRLFRYDCQIIRVAVLRYGRHGSARAISFSFVS